MAEENKVFLTSEQIRDVYISTGIDKCELGKALFEINDGFFHGSKGGIINKISIKFGRKNIDFGQGFYVGDNIVQAGTLCVSAKNSYIYRCSIDFTNLKVYRFTSSEKWVLFIAVNRGIITKDDNIKLYNYYKDLCEGYDIIVGPIADDSLTPSFYQYCNINSTLTIDDLVHVLTMVKLENQYVFKTNKAVENLKIEETLKLIGNDKLILKEISNDNYLFGKLASKMLGRIKRGKTYKQILKEWK